MISNINFFKTLIHSIINNTIFWKSVTRPFRKKKRPFRGICVNCFNILRFFCWVRHKIEKMHFFGQLKDHNSGRKHENYSNDSIIFFICFFCSTFLEYSFLNLKILKIHFQIHLFGPFWSVKYPNFSPKATDSDSASYLSRK